MQMCMLRVHTVPCLPPCWRISLKNHVAATWLRRKQWITPHVHLLPTLLQSIFIQNYMWELPKMGNTPNLHPFLHRFFHDKPWVSLFEKNWNTDIMEPPTSEVIFIGRKITGDIHRIAKLFANFSRAFLQAWAHPDETSWWERRQWMSGHAGRVNHATDFWIHRATCWKGQHVLLPEKSIHLAPQTPQLKCTPWNSTAKKFEC